MPRKKNIEKEFFKNRILPEKKESFIEIIETLSQSHLKKDYLADKGTDSVFKDLLSCLKEIDTEIDEFKLIKQAKKLLPVLNTFIDYNEFIVNDKETLKKIFLYKALEVKVFSVRYYDYGAFQDEIAGLFMEVENIVSNRKKANVSYDAMTVTGFMCLQYKIIYSEDLDSLNKKFIEFRKDKDYLQKKFEKGIFNRQLRDEIKNIIFNSKRSPLYNLK